MDHGAVWEHIRNDAQIAALFESSDHHRYAFPWDLLEQDLQQRGQSRLTIASFGALMGDDEGAHLIDDPGDHQPGSAAIVFGAKRVFEYAIPDHNFVRYGTPPRDDQRAALNAVGTGEASDFFNAVLRPIDVGRLSYLREREAGYDLCRAVYKPWDSMHEPARVCYVLSAKRDPDAGWTRSDLRPYMRYVDACRRACREVSDAFDRFFLSTSYLADMNTPLSDYLERRCV